MSAYFANTFGVTGAFINYTRGCSNPRCRVANAFGV